jgi:hypothetical protein
VNDQTNEEDDFQSVRLKNVRKIYEFWEEFYLFSGFQISNEHKTKSRSTE